MARIARVRRRTAVAAAVVAAAVLAVAVPWAVSAGRGDGGRGAATDPGVSAGPGTVIGARRGGAYQLVALHPAAGPASPAAVPAVSAADRDLTLALLRRVGGSGNVAISPASLSLALSMLQNGARGRTLAETHAALQMGRLTAEQINAGWATITRAWRAAAKADGITLASANSLWTKRGLVVRAAFLAALERWYGAGVWQTDFRTPAAVAAINAWTRANTGGRIPALFDSLAPDTRAVLANAIYFTAAWAVPFDASVTSTGRFTIGTTSVAAHFMSRTAPLAAAVTPAYSAVELPYRGNRFSAVAVLPAPGTSLSRFVAGLDGTALQRVVAGLRAQPVELRMPRFTITSTLDLNAALTSLGMHTAFSDAADFGALSPTALQVDRVVQRVHLSVGEKGTEAAAATGVSAIASSSLANLVPISLDRPFLFLVRDRTSGTILFAAEVHRPQA